MKKAVKFLSVILAVIVVAVSFAACGGSDTNNDSSENAQAVKVINIALTDEEYAFGVDKDQPELKEQANAFIAQIKEDGTLEEICNRYFEGGEPVGVTSATLDFSKDQLVVATNAAFPPYEYKNGDAFYGIDMELAKLFADYVGKELVIQDMNFNAVLTAVEQHKCDIAMAGLTVNPGRAEQVDFTDSYYTASQRVIVRGDDTRFDNCKTKEDVEAVLNSIASTAKIGGQTGTTGEAYVNGNEDFDFPGLGTNFIGYDNGSLAVQDVINKNLDIVIIDEAPAEKIVESMNAVN